MGIKGLLQFLKKSSNQVNIRNYSGCTVAVDVYCWLHKGAFSCAEKLVKGEKTNAYIFYCMKMVNILQANGLKPILVFDGCRLPSKAGTEAKRRESREKNRNQAKEFLRQGKLKEAKECFQRSVDITPEMAFELILVCRKQGIDYIVAPYEADAQLAYLNLSGIAQLVVTEDSDLILFGCEKIIYKMDTAGNGILIDKNLIPESLGKKAGCFSFEKFRYMCILSGCDYLQNLPGIGLAKSLKFFSMVTNPDLNALLPKLPAYLNMANLKVPSEYIEGFVKANNTFLYQVVFDPVKRKQVPLTPCSGDFNWAFDYAGDYHDEDVALDLALGNINVNTMRKIDNYRPAAYPNGSIWSGTKSDTSFVPSPIHSRSDMTPPFSSTPSSSTKGHEVVVPTPKAFAVHSKKKQPLSPSKIANCLSPSPTKKRIRFESMDDDEFLAVVEETEKSMSLDDGEAASSTTTFSPPPTPISQKPIPLKSRFFQTESTPNKSEDSDWFRILEEEAENIEEHSAKKSPVFVQQQPSSRTSITPVKTMPVIEEEQDGDEENRDAFKRSIMDLYGQYGFKGTKLKFGVSGPKEPETSGIHRKISNPFAKSSPPLKKEQEEPKKMAAPATPETPTSSQASFCGLTKDSSQDLGDEEVLELIDLDSLIQESQEEEEEEQSNNDVVAMETTEQENHVIKQNLPESKYQMITSPVFNSSVTPRTASKTSVTKIITTEPLKTPTLTKVMPTCRRPGLSKPVRKSSKSKQTSSSSSGGRQLSIHESLNRSLNRFKFERDVKQMEIS